MKNAKTADLFNDVMGPVMCGPSSSHTGGPCRIGHLGYDLFGEGDYKKVVIEFSTQSSYSPYKGSGSGKAVTGGLMGWYPDNENLFYAFEEAKKAGRDIELVVTDDPVPHVNTIALKGYLNNGMEVYTRMISVGGGSVAMYDIDGLRVDLYGGRYELVVWGDGAAQAKVEALVGRGALAANDALAVFSLQDPADLAAVRSLEG